MSTIAIGRRTVDKTIFEQAIESSNNWRSVCRSLDLNEKVGTTIRKIQEQAQLLGLDTSHFSYGQNYNTVVKSKEYNIITANQSYYTAFKDYAQKNFKKDSLNTYYSCVGRFLEHINNKELVNINGQEIFNYCGDKINSTRLLKTFIKYLLTDNVNGFADQCNRELLLWVITAA